MLWASFAVPMKIPPPPYGQCMVYMEWSEGKVIVFFYGIHQADVLVKHVESARFIVRLSGPDYQATAFPTAFVKNFGEMLNVFASLDQSPDARMFVLAVDEELEASRLALLEASRGSWTLSFGTVKSVISSAAPFL